jgi:hypothetical protein
MRKLFLEKSCVHSAEIAAVIFTMSLCILRMDTARLSDVAQDGLAPIVIETILLSKSGSCTVAIKRKVK